MEIDWRDLFRRYVQHVGRSEGADFLDEWTPPAAHFSEVPITEAERAAIDDLMAER